MGATLYEILDSKGCIIMNPQEIHEVIMQKLMKVIDPETGVDVIKMKLIQDLQVDEELKVSYVFRPSSPLCPLAVPLALEIIQTVREVQEINGQAITVVDYVQADELNKTLKELLED
jgi:metal-sulfur cluster biosynthetic enzyme